MRLWLQLKLIQNLPMACRIFRLNCFKLARIALKLNDFIRKKIPVKAPENISTCYSHPSWRTWNMEAPVIYEAYRQRRQTSVPIDLCRFVVSAQQKEVLRILDLVRQQQAYCFQRSLSSVRQHNMHCNYAAYRIASCRK